MGEKNFKLSATALKVGLVLLSIFLLALSMLSVMSSSRKKDLANNISGGTDKQDVYLINEPIQLERGTIVVSNVEEFGPGNKNVTAIIHYYNTTDREQIVKVSDLGMFTDGVYNYTMKIEDNTPKEYRPGEKSLNQITLTRDEGLNGLKFVTGEEMEQTKQKLQRYQGVITFDTQRNEELKEEELVLLGVEDKEYLDLTKEENKDKVYRGDIVTNCEEGEDCIEEEIKTTIDWYDEEDVSERKIGNVRELTQDKYFETEKEEE